METQNNFEKNIEEIKENASLIINEIYLSKKSVEELIKLLNSDEVKKNEKLLEEVSYEIIKRTQSDSLTLEDYFKLLNEDNDGINMFLFSSNSFMQKYIDTNDVNLKNKIKNKIESIANKPTNGDEAKELIKSSVLLFLSNTNNNKDSFESLQIKPTYGSGGLIKEVINTTKKVTTNNVVKEINKSSSNNNFDSDKKSISVFIRKISGLK